MQPACDVVDRQSALDYLFARINYERTTSVPYRSNEFKLDRMRRLLTSLGDPHLALKAVHIAGTKGKGSTAAMIASILGAAGKKVGIYTSPHLVALEERMVVDGQMPDEATFVELVAELQRAVENLDHSGAPHERRPGPTFFEITTAMAMLHFARQKVDLAVLEVGLGGRLDSTNVCQPVVCAITSISFDHMKQLGNTLGAIATEKAGIIKPGIPVVSGVLEAEPALAIETIAQERQAPLLRRVTHFEAEPRLAQRSQAFGEPFDYRDILAGERYHLADATVNMFGAHQVHNAAVAIAMARILDQNGQQIPERAIRDGLASVRCPARVEVASERPTLIVDVAHNLASIEALVQVLDDRFMARRRILVFASSRDKDSVGMLRAVLPRFDHVIFTRYLNNPRAVEPEELHALSQSIAGETANLPPIETAPTPERSLHRARELAGSDDLICFTGSFFLAAELRPLL
jgi:dihydrofolate synthase / folylpolyglutamate synthase